MIRLESMAIEMRDEKNMKGISLANRNNQITSVSNTYNQKDNNNYRIPMFANDSSTIIAEIKHIKIARENVYLYEKGSGSELHEGKTKILKIGKSKRKNLIQASMNAKFTIM